MDNLLESDRAVERGLYESRLLQPYYQWQTQLREDHGFSFGADYTSVYLRGTDSLPGTSKEASSGVARQYGSWTLLGRGTDSTGTLTYKVEHRHRVGDQSVSLSTAQVFATYLPGGGWNIGSSPIINYDWNNHKWTLPLNLTAGISVITGGKPWKFSIKLNYYVEQADPIGPEWMIGFNVTPVTKNHLMGLVDGLFN